MRKMKKGIAVALTATMVLGSSITAFATDPTPAAPGGSGTVSGSGTSEGHVNKEKLNVVLPVIDADASKSPFKYTMDPERLIQETEGEKYAEGTVFPAKDADTGVYFLTGEKTYANTSKVLQVVNKSSCDVKLTVKVKATASAGNKDIALATTSTPASGADDAPQLYLGLKVGEKDAATVVSTTEATINKTISGSPTNFETAVENNAYTYKEKANASSWKAINISLTGAVSNKDIASDTTAPTVDVTWTWAKKGDGDAAAEATDLVDFRTDTAPSITPTSYTMAADTDLDIPVSLGAGSKKATDITSVVCNGETFVAGTHYSFDAATAKLKIPSAMINFWLENGVTSTQITVTFNDTDSTPVTLNLAVASED